MKLLLTPLLNTTHGPRKANATLSTQQTWAERGIIRELEFMVLQLHKGSQGKALTGPPTQPVCQGQNRAPPPPRVEKGPGPRGMSRAAPAPYSAIGWSCSSARSMTLMTKAKEQEMDVGLVPHILHFEWISISTYSRRHWCCKKINSKQWVLCFVAYLLP